MRLSPEGLSFLSHEEGLQTSVYQDAKGLDTIGVGHLITDAEKASGTITIGGQPIPWRPGLTLQQVQDLFAQDCEAKEAELAPLLAFPPTQHQWDALCSLAFNIGIPAFSRSSLLKMLNGGDWTGLEAAWEAWRFAGGKPILLERRKREYALFQTPDVT